MTTTRLTADQLLTTVRRAKNKTLAVPPLLKKYALEKSELDAIIKTIRSWGYKLRYTSKLIKLLSTPDALIDTEIRYGLKSRLIGQKLHSYQTVKSTNTIAANLAEQGEAEGTIVTSEQQTKGKGRLGRSWESPPQTGIYLSIILRPTFKPEQAPGIAIMTALALAETAVKFTDGRVQIKWPNDLLIEKKKAAGILTELHADNNKINYIIVGVGINVNQTASDFPDSLKKNATSFRRINKRKLNRVELLQAFLCQFEKLYFKYKKTGQLSSLSKIRSYSSLIGKPVELQNGNIKINGIAKDIDPTGALIVQFPDGTMQPIRSGEVTVVKNNNK